MVVAPVQQEAEDQDAGDGNQNGLALWLRTVVLDDVYFLLHSSLRGYAAAAASSLSGTFVRKYLKAADCLRIALSRIPSGLFIFM
jgi:hypothetical protein